MWPRSRSVRTGTPATATSKSGGPITRSARIASVAVRRSPSLYPVHAAAWARPCSKPTQAGDRNGRIAIATMTSAAAMPTTRDVRAPVRVCIGRPRLLLLEGPRLLPPGVDHEVRGGGPIELLRRAAQLAPERLEVRREDVVQALDPGLDEQLVLVRPEPREVEHQRLVPPVEDVGQVGADVVGEILPAGRRLGDLEQDARREHALLLEAVEVH